MEEVGLNFDVLIFLEIFIFKQFILYIYHVEYMSGQAILVYVFLKTYIYIYIFLNEIKNMLCFACQGNDFRK